jgi:F-type H+-transporting ATPase subunit delta
MKCYANPGSILEREFLAFPGIYIVRTDLHRLPAAQIGKEQQAANRSNVADTASPTSEVAGRYAQALFDLAVDQKKIPAVEKDLAQFKSMIDDSADLKRLISSPVFSKDEQTAAIDAVLKKAKITGLVGNFIRVVASNRRLFSIPGIVQRFSELVADHRGEVSASVTSASKLSAAQVKDLKANLKSVVGKDVTLTQVVEPEILGGLIVKIGSRQIDTSLRTKLSSLKLSLKEVG